MDGELQANWELISGGFLGEKYVSENIISERNYD